MILPSSLFYTSLFTLLAAWLLDFFFGDPAWLPHPVVGFGRWITWWEHRLNRGHHRMFKGALFAIVSIALVFSLTAFLLALLSAPCCRVAWPSQLLSALLIFFCLAGRTLRHEVRDVFKALEKGLDDGRRQVARIVGRDTQALSAQEVRTAALETLAENLSDGVVAPLFWFALLGVPGMMAYKMVNTLDSMIGYRTERYRRFGCWAARIDDVANYIPARLTALFIHLAFTLLRIVCPRSFQGAQGSFVQRLRFTRRYGSCHASPNSGWPEAALAACLDCRFGGTHDYFGEAVVKPYIGHNPRELTTQDMSVSISICFAAELMSVMLAAACCW